VNAAIFQIGPMELMVIAIIAAIVLAPFVISGIVLWIVLRKPPRDPKP
jgi:hypothetical protein